MTARFIMTLRSEVEWGGDIEPGQMYQLRAPKIMDNRLLNIVITGVSLYVHEDGTPEPFLVFRIVGDDSDQNHVCTTAEYVIEHIVARLV